MIVKRDDLGLTITLGAGEALDLRDELLRLVPGGYEIMEHPEYPLSSRLEGQISGIVRQWVEGVAT